MARTSLMTWIFLSPAAMRMTSNSSFSSAPAAAASPPPAAGAAATATGAAAVTPNSSSNALRKSLSSRTVMFLNVVEQLFGGCHRRVSPVALLGLGLGLGLGSSAGRLGVRPRPRRRLVVGGRGLGLASRRDFVGGGVSALLARCRLGGRLVGRRRASPRGDPLVDERLDAVGEVAGERLEQARPPSPAAPGTHRRSGRAARRATAARPAPRCRRRLEHLAAEQPALHDERRVVLGRSRAAPSPRRRRRRARTRWRRAPRAARPRRRAPRRPSPGGRACS